jgi:hypothetical protein
LQHRTDYACLSNHSTWSSDSFSDYYYNCVCNHGYQGNAYISDGCSRDKGNYSPRIFCSIYVYIVKYINLLITISMRLNKNEINW